MLRFKRDEDQRSKSAIIILMINHVVEIFPSFIARSRKNPTSELRDPEKWTQMWMEARHWLATSPDAPKTAYDWLH